MNTRGSFQLRPRVSFLSAIYIGVLFVPLWLLGCRWLFRGQDFSLSVSEVSVLVGFLIQQYFQFLSGSLGWKGGERKRKL